MLAAPILGVAILSIVILGAGWTYRESATLRDELDRSLAAYEAERRATLMERVHEARSHINFARNRIEADLEKGLRRQVGHAMEIAEHLYDRYHDRGDAAVAELIREALRPIRSETGKGYFFAFDRNGIEQLYPPDPSLEGVDMVHGDAAPNRSVVGEMLAMLKDRSEAFYRYDWTQPGASGVDHRKLSFIRVFEPLNWVIGTGEYVEDFEADLKARILARLESMKFEDGGYIFVGGWEGVSLIEPMRGRNMLDIEDANGVKIVRKLIATAKKGGGFVEYVMPDFGSSKPFRKISYVMGVPEWQWYVGTGASLQAIETENAERLKKGELRILQLIGLTISVALLMIGVSVLVTRNVARRVRSDYRAFSAFFEKAAQGVATIDPAAIGIGEFEELAHGANRMVAERQAYQARASLAEDALHRSEARFLAMAGAAPMSIAVKDLDGHFEWANDELLNRCMMSLDTLIGKTSYDLHPKEIADEVSRVEKIALTTRTPQLGHIDLTFPDGVSRTELFVRFPIFDADGREIGIGDMGLDITEQRSTERQLLQAQKMEAVGQLTGGVAHDFNNLLQVVQTNLELARLHATDADGPLAQYLDRALNAGLRGAALTQKLLAFSRKQTLRPRTLDPDALIEGMLELLERTLGEDIRIDTRLEAKGRHVFVDESGLENAVLNLALNARGAMANGGVLTVTSAVRRLGAETAVEGGALPAGDYVEIAVADNGCGMPEEVLNHAFEPFFTTKEIGKGSGLGLSMTYGFARQSDGNITLESTPGKGTTARILLPAVAAPETSGELCREFAAENGCDAAVLVVEDDPEVRASTVNVLQSLGCTVCEAGEAEEALTCLDQDPGIELLLSDVVLTGGRNGIELAKEAVRRRPGLRVLLVSGYPETELRRSGLTESHFALLGKPFTRASLVEAMKRALS